MSSHDDAFAMLEKLGPVITSLDDPNVELLNPHLREALCEFNGMLWIKHPWVNSFVPMVGQANEIWSWKFSAMREYLSERNLHAYLFVIVERPWRYTTLERWWEHEKITHAELCELLPDVWQDTEMPTDNSWSPLDLWIDAGFVTDDEAAWEALPDEFTVWRGGRPQGIAWTLSRETGLFFANRLRLAHQERLLWRATVRKDEVCGFLTGRGEQEVIVEPDAVVRERF